MSKSGLFSISPFATISVFSLDVSTFSSVKEESKSSKEIVSSPTLSDCSGKVFAISISSSEILLSISSI